MIAPSRPPIHVSPRHARIAERDGWTCAYCGMDLLHDGSPAEWVYDRRYGWMILMPPRRVGPQFPEIDHRVPRSRGGGNEPENLCLACGFCNAQKGARTADEYAAWKASR